MQQRERPFVPVVLETLSMNRAARMTAVHATQLTSNIVATSSFNRALGVVGDRWALQILRGSFAGVRRFEQLQACSGAPRSTLADRLNGLVDRGVLERVRYCDNPPRYEYRLSEQGVDLHGATMLLLGWEQAWTRRSAALQPLRHNACGHVMSAELICSLCGQQVAFENTEYEIRPVTGQARVPAPLFHRHSCPKNVMDQVAGGSLGPLTDIIGDRWSLMVLWAGFLRLRRFDAIQGALRIATNILAHRLNQLVEHGLYCRRSYSKHPPRYEYHLTKKGRELFPVAFMLTQWGDRWLVPHGAGGNLRVRHSECGWLVRGILSCRRCGEPIRPHEVDLPVRPVTQAPRSPERSRAESSFDCGLGRVEGLLDT